MTETTEYLDRLVVGDRFVLEVPVAQGEILDIVVAKLIVGTDIRARDLYLRHPTTHRPLVEFSGGSTEDRIQLKHRYVYLESPTTVEYLGSPLRRSVRVQMVIRPAFALGPDSVADAVITALRRADIGVDVLTVKELGTHDREGDPDFGKVHDPENS